MNIVTSFSPSGWGYYGKRFVDSFLANWPPHVNLHVFLEGQEPPAGYGPIHWHDLRDDWEHEEFVTKWSGPEWNSKTDYNEMSVRFCHKVFAITSPRLPATGWRVWIDADVVTKTEVDDAWLARVLPPDKALTFLGRKGFMRPLVSQPAYTECGFVGYNLDHLGVRPMLNGMRHIYTSGELFNLGRHNWHDSYVFDYCRKQQDFKDTELHNLAAHCDAGTFHPWPRTELGKVMEHYKGPGRKAGAYGRHEPAEKP